VAGARYRKGSTTDEVNDFQPVSLGQGSFVPLLPRNDGSIQLNRHAVGLDAQLLEKTLYG
jgi:hypothetical protein